MRDIRQSILEGRFLDLYREKRAFLHESDADHPILLQKPRRKMAFHRGDYEVHFAREGFASIRQISSGEIMHARTPPMEEARQLYIEQSGLAERLRVAGSEDAPAPLVIWDVGLGAAANAMAAILCWEAQAAAGYVRPMHIISFENDLDPLRLAFQHNREFTYLRHSGIGGILGAGEWQSSLHPGLRWTLIQGDFLSCIPKAPAPPDIIFFDMFSTKTDGASWTLAAFRQVFAACGGRAAELFTYTCSTASRAGLLVAGFHVARGRNAGAKMDTTIALTPAAARSPEAGAREWLGADWLSKWSRSSARFPADLPAEEQLEFERAIRCHPQFLSA